jgi:hypothetical protein
MAFLFELPIPLKVLFDWSEAIRREDRYWPLGLDQHSSVIFGPKTYFLPLAEVYKIGLFEGILIQQAEQRLGSKGRKYFTRIGYARVSEEGILNIGYKRLSLWDGHPWSKDRAEELVII